MESLTTLLFILSAFGSILIAVCAAWIYICVQSVCEFRQPPVQFKGDADKVLKRIAERHSRGGWDLE